ncbi:hypothetical protein MLD52_19890 [Puniceicoccaceae bacterium K14]|nr:hypothetical protein [Puniceicoccaceae bacterium K14]
MNNPVSTLLYCFLASFTLQGVHASEAAAPKIFTDEPEANVDVVPSRPKNFVDLVSIPKLETASSSLTRQTAEVSTKGVSNLEDKVSSEKKKLASEIKSEEEALFKERRDFLEKVKRNPKLIYKFHELEEKQLERVNRLKSKKDKQKGLEAKSETKQKVR